MATVNDSTFDQVLKAPLAVVDFWNDRCPHCRNYKPVFDAVAAEMGDKLLMVTANTDETQKYAGQYGLTGVPTTIFFANGKEVHRISGEMSKQDLMNEVSKGLNLSEKAITSGEAPPVGETTLGDVLVGGAVVAGVIYGMTQLA